MQAEVQLSANSSTEKELRVLVDNKLNMSQRIHLYPQLYRTTAANRSGEVINFYIFFSGHF